MPIEHCVTDKKDYKSQVDNNLQELNRHYHYAIKQLLLLLVNLSGKKSGVLYHYMWTNIHSCQTRYPVSIPNGCSIMPISLG